MGNAVVDHRLQPIVQATCSSVPSVGLPYLRGYGSSYDVNEVCLQLHGTLCTVPGKLNTFLNLRETHGYRALHCFLLNII